MKCLLSGEFIRYLGLQANSFSAYYSNSADKHYGKLSIMSAQADFAFFHPPASHLKVGMSRYVVMPKQARLLVPIAHQVLDMYAGILGSSSSIWHLVCSLSLNIFLHNSSFV
jgi:hypothetical protein